MSRHANLGECALSFVLEEQPLQFGLSELTPWQYRWQGLEPPANIDRSCVRRHMTPIQALSLALDGEKRAYEFFTGVLDDSSDECVCELAADFAEDEEQHVVWVEEWLANVRRTTKEHGRLSMAN